MHRSHHFSFASSSSIPAPIRPAASHHAIGQAVVALLLGGGMLAGASGPARAQAGPSTATGAATVLAPAARPAQAAIAFDIPPGPLTDTLNRYASAAGVALSFSTELTVGKQSPGVRGSATVAEGFERVLAGSGLQAVQTGPGRYALAQLPQPAQQGSGGGATLRAVTVTAQAQRPSDLPEAYAGGQVATGGQVGMLGNKDVMDTPFNITNYTSQLIENQQAGTVLDVLQNDPSVRQSAAPGEMADAGFRIRGFDVGTRAVMFNGLSGLAPDSGNLSVAFAERVEVLKGPSALLYGMSPSGVVGGAVNLVPKRAGDTPLTRLTLGVESNALWSTQVDTGRRFGANNEWGLRFNGGYKDGDGFIDGAKSGGYLGALALDYRSERLRMSLDAYRLQNKLSGARALNATVANWSAAPSWLSSMPAAPDGRTNVVPGAPEFKETTQAAILGGEYDFNDRWTGYAKLGVGRTEADGFYDFVQNIQANGDGTLALYDSPQFVKTKTGETGLRGRFQTGTVSHALALSASYLNLDRGGAWAFSSQPTNIYRPAPISVAWPASPTPTPKTSETNLSGIALADTLGFIDDRVLLTLGVRRQNVKTTNFDSDTGAATSGYDASAWTPMAGLVVKPTDDLSLYANVIQGLSEGTTVGSDFQNAGQVFPPYKTEQIEVGAKWQTGSFTNTISVFQIAKPSTIADDSTTPLPTLRLNGEQRNRGIEWTIFGELARGLRMLGGVTYTQARLTKTQDGLQDGNQAAGAPPWSANLGLDWDVPGLPGLALNGRVIYTSTQWVDNVNSLKMPSWSRLDLGARYATTLGGRLVVFRAGVDNVFDKNYWQGVFGSGSVNLGAPRIFRLSASVDF